jgi:hypothetical protein
MTKKIEEMINEAEEMGKYYFKQFGNSLAAVVSIIGIYSKKNKKEYYDSANEFFGELEDAYKTIPFEKLQGRENYYPLFVVDTLLKKYRKMMDEFFEEPGEDEERRLYSLSCAISELGTLYRNCFMSLLKEIQSTPEGKDFKIKLKDFEGKEWIL